MPVKQLPTLLQNAAFEGSHYQVNESRQNSVMNRRFFSGLISFSATLSSQIFSMDSAPGSGSFSIGFASL